MNEKISLIGLNLQQIKEYMAQMGEKPYRAQQIYQWVYIYGVDTIDKMSNINKEFRQKLAQKFTLGRLKITQKQPSADGTIKWLVAMHDGNEVEMVFIPEKDRGTLCISSQVGCSLTCTFCHTGTQRLVRNLTANEIVGQILLARDELGEWPSSKMDRFFSNIVFMGMGEPLMNTEEVIHALKIVCDGDGLAFSKRKVTLSTSGVVPEIRRIGDEIGCNLAISLHAVRDELRDILVPINKKYPLRELIHAVKNYPGLYLTNQNDDYKGRRVTWEYVMLNEINDFPDDAHELVHLIKGIPSKINLIPFNPWHGSGYEPSTPERIEEFAQIIRNAGYPSPVRRPRGADIMAACGQLKSASQNLSAREKRMIEANENQL